MGESIKVRKVGKYILKEKLGEGSMGSVWLSYHSGLGIPVALKLLNMELAKEDPDFLNRFMKEGQLAGQLNHKNIVRIYDAGTEGSDAYIVMEFIEGCDTLELLNARGALPPDEVLALAIGIGEALQEAHSLGIIHRDIKPDNILATNEGRIKLADLGLAKKMDDNMGSTMAGTALGTPYYISPEQALDAMKADERSDIYSLGATLYHLLSGFLPYEGDNAMGVMLRHTNEPLTPPQQKKPGLPESFCRVICKMMEKDPAKRYQNCTELLVDLNKLKYGDDEVAMSEKELSQQVLTSSKSVRVKMKIPNKGKYAHREGIVTKRDLKKRSKSSQSKKAKKKSPLVPAVSLLAILGLIILLIPSLLKSEEEKPHEVKVEDNQPQPKVKVLETAPVKEKAVVDTPEKIEPVKKEVENKVDDDLPHLPENEINLLSNEGRDHLVFRVPEYVSFKDGNLILEGEREKGINILHTKDIYSNYIIHVEYKWLDEKCDTGISVHCDYSKSFEVNIANTWSRTGAVHARGGTSFKHNGIVGDFFKPERRMALDLGVWYKGILKCDGQNISFSVNGNELTSVEGLSDSSGKLRIGMWKKINIEIRKLTLTPLN